MYKELNKTFTATSIEREAKREVKDKNINNKDERELIKIKYKGKSSKDN